VLARPLAVLALALGAVGALLMASPPPAPKARAAAHLPTVLPLPTTAPPAAGATAPTDWHDDEAEVAEVAEVAEEHYCAH